MRYRNCTYYIVLFCLLFCTFCRNQDKENENIQKIVFEESINWIEQENKKNIIDSVRYIQLETNNDCLISYVSQLLCTAKEIFIFDIYTQSVYVFDYAGKYLRKLHKQGQGPGEYLTILSISMDETSNELYIVDSGNCVLCYDLFDFHFLWEKKIDAIAVQKDEKNSFIAYNAMPVTYKDVLYHEYLTKHVDGEIVCSFIPIDFSSGYLMTPNYRFYKYNQALYFSPPFQSLVYKIQDNQCIPFYDIQYGIYDFPSLDALKNRENNGNYILNLRNENYVYSAQIFENDEYLVATYYVGLRTYIGIYNKITHKTMNFLRKDFQKEPTAVDWLNIVAVSGKEFVMILNHADIIESKNEIDDKVLKNLILMSEDSNPIIAFLHFKI